MEYIKTKYAENETVKPFVIISQDLMKLIYSLIVSITDQGTSIPLAQINKVSLMALCRIRESLKSILLLSLNGFVRDANILLLTLIELKLDIKYIGLNEERANLWMNHSRDTFKPWKVKNIISELYSDSSEREATENIYRYYSTIKHANPAAGNSSFPLGINNRWLAFETDKHIENYIAVALFATGLQIIGIVETVIDSFVSRGFVLDKEKESVKNLKKQLNELNVKHLKLMLLKYFKNIYNSDQE